MSNSNSNPKDIIRRYNQEILKYYNQQKQDSIRSGAPDSVSSLQNMQNPQRTPSTPDMADSRSMSGIRSTETAAGNNQNITGSQIPDMQNVPDTQRTQIQDTISDRYPEPEIPSYMSSSLLPGVSPSTASESEGSTGWLSASLAAADNTIPIGNALVLVTDDNNNLLSILTTNDSGKTRSIALSTPSKALSETPSSAIPYSSYNMNVFKKGYYEVVMQNISVFPDTESIQLVNMVPLPFANPFDTLVFPQTPVNQ